MSTDTIPLAATARITPWLRDLALAALIALALLAIHAAAGFPTLSTSRGDNDSLLRLVEVRDLLAGQDWFDTMQYRMGPEGGFLMHWSRLVDAPIAAIIVATTALTGSAETGELVALVAWPSLLVAAAMFALLRLARTFGGEEMLLPVAILGGAALHFAGIFAPGALDHHNVQLALALGAVALIAEGTQRAAFAAGIAVALMLAIGIETVALVAAAGLWMAGAFLFGGEDARKAALGFGLSFAGTAGFAFIATVAPVRWGTVTCDAYSVAQFGMAAIGGAGLALSARVVQFDAPWSHKALALGSVGAVAAVTAIVFFRDCLGDPLASLDPRLQRFWLDSVTEAMPVWTILTAKPAMAPAYYATPLLALAWLAFRVARGTFRPLDGLVAIFLATAVAVSFWQVRGAMFSVPLATIPLSAWAADTRRAARQRPGVATTLAMAAAWVLSLNMVWAGGGRLVASQFGVGGAPRAERLASACYAHDDYVTLAELPSTTVLAVSNLGAPILRNTHHRVLAGPYHRNVDGNLLVLDAFMGGADAARKVIRDNGIDLVALCPGNDESGVLAGWAPAGFMAQLREGRLPTWLEPVPGTGSTPLRLFRPRNGD